jgi:glycosyltransferase involved in cell wall biosynthesis
MAKIALVVPGSLTQVTGGYRYDRRMAAGLQALGWEVEVHELQGSFPTPAAAALEQAAAALASIPTDTTALIDGLALGAMPRQAAREAERLRVVALVHHPLCAETGLPPELAARLEASEAEALRAARLVVVTSRRTACAVETMFGVPRGAVVVIEPGIDLAPLAPGSGGGTFELLCVANVIPRKGHEVLIAALGSIADKRWRLTCAGSLQRDPALAKQLRDRIRASGLEDRVSLVGELDEAEVARLYQRADAFVLPSLYEGYGMAVAEAIACGLPVVSTPVGAAPDLVGKTAGLLVPAGDPAALAAALASLMDDPALLRRLRAGAVAARAQLRTWEQAAALLADALAPSRIRDARVHR